MILEQEKAKRVQQYVNTLRGMPGSCYETSSPEFRVPLIPTAIRRIDRGDNYVMVIEKRIFTIFNTFYAEK